MSRPTAAVNDSGVTTGLPFETTDAAFTEEANGWVNEVGGLAQTKFRGLDRVGWIFTFKVAAYNLVRLPRLIATG